MLKAVASACAFAVLAFTSMTAHPQTITFVRIGAVSTLFCRE